MHIAIEAKGTAPRYYVNHAEINITPFEMAITFAQLPPRFDAGESERLSRGEPITVPVEVQILIPISFVDGLIKAMSGQKADYDRLLAPQFAALVKPKPDE
jgi:hypothetical protein